MTTATARDWLDSLPHNQLATRRTGFWTPVFAPHNKQRTKQRPNSRWRRNQAKENPIMSAYTPNFASDPNADPDMLETLFPTNNEATQMALAGNPNTPRDVLSGLAGSPYPKVRAHLVNHPHLTGLAVAMLRQDTDPQVVAAVKAASESECGGA